MTSLFIEIPKARFLRYAGSPPRIASLHLDNGTNDIRTGTFWSRLGSLFWRKQQTILSPHQSTMKGQQRRRLQCDRHAPEPIRLNPERTETGDQPIQNATIRCTASGPIQDQEPMFDQNGFRNDAA